MKKFKRKFKIACKFINVLNWNCVWMENILLFLIFFLNFRNYWSYFFYSKLNIKKQENSRLNRQKLTIVLTKTPAVSLFLYIFKERISKFLQVILKRTKKKKKNSRCIKPSDVDRLFRNISRLKVLQKH